MDVLRKHAHLWLLFVGLVFHLLSIPLLALDPLNGDAKQFNNEANNILDGVGWVNTEGPGQATTTYPTQVGFLLLCKFVFGRDALIPPVIIQHIFVLLTALIAYHLALTVGLSRASALLAQAMVIFFPHMVYWSNVLVSHTLGMLLSVLGVFLLMRDPAKSAAYLGIGLVWGAATLARFSYQYFIPIWVVTMLIVEFARAKRITSSRLLKASLLLGGFLIVLSPWNIRVHRYEGGSSGYTDAWRICYGFNRAPEERGNVRDEFLLSLEADSTLTRSEREAAARAQVFRNLREHPEWFINNGLTNLSLLLTNTTTWGQPQYAVYAGMYYAALLAFGLVGLISLGKARHKRFLPAYVFGGVILGVHVPTYGYIGNAFPVWAALSPIVATGAILSIRAAWVKRKG